MSKNVHSSAARTLSMLLGLSFMLAITLTTPYAGRAAGVHYVAPTAAGSGDCSSWANTCILQTALGNAISSDEIWVMQGVHKPGIARTDTFILKNGVALYGGFDGTETSLDERDWTVNITVLSGDIDQNDVNTDGNFIAETSADIQGANAYHVVTGGLTNNTAVLDGFVVTAGQANSASPHGDGGGMYNQDASPQLTNLIFSGNTSSGGGGGMYNLNSHPLLTDVTFSGNTSTDGGGMHNTHYSAPTLIQVTFDGNGATNGGGMANGGDNTSPVLQGVIFRSNTAGDRGGGMYNAQYNSNGGMLTDVVFSGNTAVDGGGMYNNNISPTVINAIFIGNMAAYGGGVHNYRSNVELINATFNGNTASSQGGGMYSWWSGSPRLKNAIVWGNSAPVGPGIVDMYSNVSLISYSDVQECGGSGAGWNSACGTDTGGNIDADPLFTDASGGDLRLQPPSPAIDAGNNTAVPAGITTDLDGNPRFADVLSVPDTGNGDPPIVDMGAYEAQVNVTIGKFVSPSVVEPGQAITFTLTLSNRGNITATHIVVTDLLPAFLTNVSFTSTLSITDTGHIPLYVWDVQPLLPEQSGIITTTGLLPLPQTAGVYTNTAVIAAVGDSLADDNTAVIIFTVPNLAPVFISPPVTTATQDSPYTYVATAEDNNGDTLTLTAPTLPGWLALTDHGDGTAVLSGTPTDADVGQHSVVLRVTDSGGLTDTQAFTITVSNVNDAPVFTSTPVTTATQDAPYTYNITANDIDAGDALTIIAPTLPGWLALSDHGDGTAALSGTPTDADVGQHSVVLRVTDSGGLFVEQTFTITVTEKLRFRAYLPLVSRSTP